MEFLAVAISEIEQEIRAPGRAGIEQLVNHRVLEARHGPAIQPHAAGHGHQETGLERAVAKRQLLDGGFGKRCLFRWVLHVRGKTRIILEERHVIGDDRRHRRGFDFLHIAGH